jgi:hypothetical protein
VSFERTCSSETSADFQRTARRYISEDCTPHYHRCGNFKSYIKQIVQERAGTIKNPLKIKFKQITVPTCSRLSFFPSLYLEFALTFSSTGTLFKTLSAFRLLKTQFFKLYCLAKSLTIQPAGVDTISLGDVVLAISAVATIFWGVKPFCDSTSSSAQAIQELFPLKQGFLRVISASWLTLDYISTTPRRVVFPTFFVPLCFNSNILLKVA